MKLNKELREIAAMLAMQGILSDPSELPRVCRSGRKLSCSQGVAVRAVRQADALIKELAG